MANTTLDGAVNPSAPIAAAGPQVELVPATVLTTDTNDAISPIVNVQQAGRITLWIAYDAGGGVGGYPQIVPMISGALAAPAVADDRWYGLGVSDTAPTDANLAGITLPAGAAYTLGPEWREEKEGPLVLRTFGADGAEAIRVAVPIDVRHARWLYLAAAEVGDPANPGTLQIDWSIAT